MIFRLSCQCLFRLGQLPFGLHGVRHPRRLDKTKQVAEDDKHRVLHQTQRLDWLPSGFHSVHHLMVAGQSHTMAHAESNVHTLAHAHTCRHSHTHAHMRTHTRVHTHTRTHYTHTMPLTAAHTLLVTDHVYEHSVSIDHSQVVVVVVETNLVVPLIDHSPCG